MSAGQYSTRFAWYRRTPGSKDTYGGRGDGHPVAGYLWGSDVEDLVASRETAQESERQTTAGTVRLRNYPGVKAGDRLRDAKWGELWTVQTVARRDNETHCEVTRPRFTTGGGTA